MKYEKTTLEKAIRAMAALSRGGVWGLADKMGLRPAWLITWMNGNMPSEDTLTRVREFAKTQYNIEIDQKQEEA